MKRIKRVGMTVLILMIALLLGLVINNRLLYAKYSKINTNTESLTETDLQNAYEVYAYLEANGEKLFKGFDGKSSNLILYNDSFEFLFFDEQPTDPKWQYIGEDDVLHKAIYRRSAENPQAFAIKVDDTWVGSFATMDTYNKQIIIEIPFFFPPQFMMADTSFYQAIVIHEMVHAYQGLLNSSRVDTAEHIHGVCSNYYSNRQFNDLIELEGKYLEDALQAKDLDTMIENVHLFLSTREERRQTCQLTPNEMQEEQEMEWLEGLARYAEYNTSRDSSSSIAKGLLDISEKVKVKNDDRYYALGMAEYMVILKLDENSADTVIYGNDTLERLLKELTE